MTQPVVRSSASVEKTVPAGVSDLDLLVSTLRWVVQVKPLLKTKTTK